MITQADLVKKFGQFTRNNSVTNLDLGNELINQHRKTRLNSFDYIFTHKTVDITTVAGQSDYVLPKDIKKLRGAYIKDGGYSKELIEISSIDQWARLLTTTSSATYPTHFFPRGKKVSFYPTPSDNGIAITMPYKIRAIAFNPIDYTTGTINVTNNSALVSGNTTSWNSDMIGQHIELPDGQAYKIINVLGLNLLQIDIVYPGITDINQSYRIGDMEIFPTGSEYLALYDAVSEYFLHQEGKIDQSNTYKAKADELELRMRHEEGNGTTDPAITTRGNRKFCYKEYIPPVT